MKNNTKDVAVIMTVHNRKAQTIECLNHLYNEASVFDVYLTDDGCTDGTSEEIVSKFPNVYILNGDQRIF